MRQIKPRRTFGRIEELSSGKFRAYYRGPDGTRHRAPHTFFDSGDAAAWLRGEQKLIEFGDWTPPATRRQSSEDRAMTVGDWIKEWMALRSAGADALAPSTQQSYWKDFNLRVLHVKGKAARLRDIPLTQLTRRDVAVWWDALLLQFDGATANYNAYRRLRTALNAAVDRDLIQANPGVLKEAARRPKTQHKELPAQEVMQAIVDQLDRAHPKIDGAYKLVAILTFFHGLRLGEALGLRRRDFTDTGDVITVHVRGTCYRSTTPGVGMVRRDRAKTDAGHRDVPIFPTFHDDVRWHLDHMVGSSPDAMVFTTGTGAIVMDTSYRSVLARAKKRAGYDDIRITPHYGRNWVITTLAEAGMPIPAIGEFLGQRDLRTITEVYMRATDTRKQEVLDAVNRQFAPPEPVADLDAKRAARKAAGQ